MVELEFNLQNVTNHISYSWAMDFQHPHAQGWAGMTFEDSGTGRELIKPIPEIREREGNWKSPFPKFGNGKGIKNSIPKFREWEGNEKIPFPKFGNGKGMKKIHSQNSGTGREWKNPFPKFGKGNQRPPFLGMTGNGNSCSPLGGDFKFTCWLWFIKDILSRRYHSSITILSVSHNHHSSILHPVH